MDMYSSVIKVIEKYKSLNNEDLQLIKSVFKPKFSKKNSILIDQNELASKSYFINSGYLRYYKIADGNQLTIHLLSPMEFATSFDSFISGTKSNEILQVITDSDLLEITKKDLEKLYNSSSAWQIFGRRLMEDLLIVKEARIIDQISLSAEERYLKLFQTNPALIQQVPIQYVASYIGIQPESLSRIRRKIIS